MNDLLDSYCYKEPKEPVIIPWSEFYFLAVEKSLSTRPQNGFLPYSFSLTNQFRM